MSRATDSSALRHRHLLALAVAAALLLALGQNGPVEEQDVGEFLPWKPMASPRAFHTATTLDDGRILLAGGSAGSFPIGTAEVYDPVTEAFTLSPPMVKTRFGHTATLLQDGRVLIAGGRAIGDIFEPAAELYDPVRNAFSLTGPMAVGRADHTATLLPDGTVLIVGGLADGNRFLAEAELYDPVAGTFDPTSSMAIARSGHTATLLRGGRVLMVGGFGAGDTAVGPELYDPATGRFSKVDSSSLPRGDHTATLLVDGRVLLAGGTDPDENMIRDVEIYNPDSREIAPAEPLFASRAFHTATLLPDGRVLLAGGTTATLRESVNIPQAELFDPMTNRAARVAALFIPRSAHTTTPLPDGSVLIAGGFISPTQFLGLSEIYVPPAQPPSEEAYESQTPGPATPLTQPSIPQEPAGGFCSGRAGASGVSHLAMLILPLGLLSLRVARGQR